LDFEDDADVFGVFASVKDGGEMIFLRFAGRFVFVGGG
jgi:hypothetical protein